MLAVLLLRGAQTVGELRQRTERLQTFPDLESVEVELTGLIAFQNLSSKFNSALGVPVPPQFAFTAATRLGSVKGISLMT